ncbi:MAG TPA: DUF503 domain-containing protein [Limnochordia bacterium]|nr:DUF503 domain-containing protein [Limnochordia bacterium]
MPDGDRLYLGLVTLDLVIPGSASLKEKRRVVRGLKDRLKSRLDVSVAEVAFQDLHQRAKVAVACVGSDRRAVEKTLRQALSIAESRDGAEVCDWSLEWR